jgi:predicted MPP superfamily phosphohydrolase
MIKKVNKRYMYPIIIAIVLFSIIYNIYDNNRFKVEEQTVKLDNLPQSFNNFKILQITDLHEKSFGQNQKELVDGINKLDYDIIVVTGDIVNKETVNMKPFEELIKGIKKKDLVFFVGGNNDPKVFDKNGVTSFGKRLKEDGCILLDKPYPIKRDKDTLWVLQYLLLSEEDNEDYRKIKKEDIRIGLSHYPLTEEKYKLHNALKGLRYDLLLAGHYHGGQIRIPLIGALYVPKGGVKGFLPSEKEVSGLQDNNNFRQYVSRGLGSSGPKLLAFRLFDTPEINIITLKK